jgi:hypothetical protein
MNRKKLENYADWLKIELVNKENHILQMTSQMARKTIHDEKLVNVS